MIRIICISLILVFSLLGCTTFVKLTVDVVEGDTPENLSKRLSKFYESQGYIKYKGPFGQTNHQNAWISNENVYVEHTSKNGVLRIWLAPPREESKKAKITSRNILKFIKLTAPTAVVHIKEITKPDLR